MASEFLPRDIAITLRGAYEAPDWLVYLTARISQHLGTEEILRWWSETNEHEWFDFFDAILGSRLGEKQAQREWERLISFWLEHRRDDLSGLVESWRMETEKLLRKMRVIFLRVDRLSDGLIKKIRI